MTIETQNKLVIVFLVVNMVANLLTLAMMIQFYRDDLPGRVAHLEDDVAAIQTSKSQSPQHQQ